jgi:hypothetical protein
MTALHSAGGGQVVTVLPLGERLMLARSYGRPYFGRVPFARARAGPSHHERYRVPQAAPLTVPSSSPGS